MALPPPSWGRVGVGGNGSPSPLVGEGWGGGEWLSLPPRGGGLGWGGMALPPPSWGRVGVGGGIVPHSTVPSIPRPIALSLPVGARALTALFHLARRPRFC